MGNNPTFRKRARAVTRITRDQHTKCNEGIDDVIEWITVYMLRNVTEAPVWSNLMTRQSFSHSMCS